MLRAQLEQRLTAAAEEILQLFGRTVEDIFQLLERTVEENRQELLRAQKDNRRQRRILDAVLQPRVRLHRADLQQLLGEQEEGEVPPELQAWTFSPDQKPPHVKKEEEQLWSSREEEQLEHDEAGLTKVPFTPVPVKSEDEEEKPPSSQLQSEGNIEAKPPSSSSSQHMKTEAEGDEGGGSEPAGSLAMDQRTSCSPETEVSDEDQIGPRDPQSIPDVANSGGNSAEKPFGCSVCGKAFRLKCKLKVHLRIHSEKKRFSCSSCSKGFNWTDGLVNHVLRFHPGEKPFSCSVCKKTFWHCRDASRHERVHRMGDLPTCTVCGKSFTLRKNLNQHMRIHTGEKPFSCSLCTKRFGRKIELQTHLRCHMGQNMYTCTICGGVFSEKSSLLGHMCPRATAASPRSPSLVLPQDPKHFL